VPETAMNTSWPSRAVEFLNSLVDPLTGGSSSVPGGNATLYGTCYSALAKDYLQSNSDLSEQCRAYLVRHQDPESGLMIGPELQSYHPSPSAVHDREHLILHLTCAALPTFQHFGLQPKYEIRAAHPFCELDFLNAWLDKRDLRSAWLEGNNLLFVGQLLVYLRDVERRVDAQPALDLWFRWLDHNLDPATNLWGTDSGCLDAEAVYGGYHQFLVYYHEGHSIMNPRGLIDTVLGLQHWDGGFSPTGNGGACEDVDSVDILVNLYKRCAYRRAEIRNALTRCVNHILRSQSVDGGFPYNRDCEQSHMGIPDTAAPANTSTTFATWFRIHTLALCAEIVPDHPALRGIQFRFSRSLSMGWHASPDSWKLHVSNNQKIQELSLVPVACLAQLPWSARRIGGRIMRRLGLM
jgi:hypothetical protein